MTRLLYCLFFLALPAVSYRGLPSQFEGAKAYLLYGFVVLLFALNFKKIFASFKTRTVYFSAFAFFAWALVCSLVGPNFVKSLVGNYYRYDGLVTLFFLIVFSFITSKVVKKEDLIAIASAMGAGLLASAFGNANFLAGYLLVTLPFVLMVFQKVSMKFLYFVVLLGIMVHLGSIGGLLGMFLYLGIFWLRRHASPILFKKTSYVFAVIFMLVCAVVVLSRPDLPLQARGRERIFRRATSASLVSPLVGWGWANVDYAIARIDWPIRVYRDVYIDKAHSHLLEVLVTTGVAGLAIYLFLLVKTFDSAVAAAHKDRLAGALLFAFMLFVFHSQTNVISISEEILFWFSLGLIAGFEKLDR